MYLFANGWGKCHGPKQAYQYVYDHYLDCFPDLPSFSAFNRRLNRLAHIMSMVLDYCTNCLERVGQYLSQPMVLTNSFPIITGLANRCNCYCTLISDRGYCAAKKQWYYGVKLHLGAYKVPNTLPQIGYAWISPASIHDKS